jgi:glycosyltransferase involved in cell wall biosynthesis
LFKNDFANREKVNKLYRDSHLPNQTELPLVSVCIPAYNSESTLGETLEAVLAQDYPRLDVVVSDNQSTDGTKAIVQRYADHGVRYCWHAAGRPSWAVAMPNYIGGYANWDFVLSQGHGEYLCLFHSDDLYEPTIVREQVDVMRAHPNVAAVFTRSRMIDENGHPIKLGLSNFPDELRGYPTFDFATLLNMTLIHHNFLPPSSVMLRRSVVDNMQGFDERHFLTSADLEMWLRIAQQGYEIAFIDQPLVKYRISQRQFGSQYNKLRTNTADFFSVLDHFLRQPAVQTLVKVGHLKIYELQRAADQVLCAMNLLTQGRIPEALAMLNLAIRVKYFIIAYRRPRLLARLVVGFCFWISAHLGFGILAGRLVYYAYQHDLQQRQKPVKN